MRGIITDAKAMADLHTDDVNFINIFGQWWKGRNEVEEGLRRGHSVAFAKSKMQIDIEQVKFLSANVAVAHGTMELLDAPPDTLGRCHFIRVLVRGNGGGSLVVFKTLSFVLAIQRLGVA